MKAATSDGLQEWRSGWSLVLTSAMGIGIGTYYVASAGVVMQPLEDAFGWSRGQISAVAAIKSTALILCSPLLGWAVDRFGARRVAIPGVIAYCLSFALVGLTGPSIWTWYAAWVLAALTGVWVSSTTWTAAVAGRFEKHRGLALGATLAGHGLTSAMIPPFAVWALEAFGWRGVYFALGGLGLVAALPLTLLFFHEGDRSVRRRTRAEAVAAAAKLPGMSFSAAIRQARYWRLGLAFCVGAGAMGAFQLHLLPMMMDTGLTARKAAAFLAIMGPMTVVGRLLGGFLMDRIFAPYVAAAAFALPILNCFFIPHIADTPGLAFIVVAIAGLCAGAEVDSIAVLTTRYFGMRSYGRVYAPLTAMFAVGYGYAGALGGVLYDAFGSYDVLLVILAILLSIAVLLILTLGRYPTFSKVDDEPAGEPAPLPA